MLIKSALNIQNFAANMAALEDSGIDTGDAKTKAELADSGIFSIVQNFFTVVGVIIVLFVLWKVVKSFAKGDFAGVAKVIAGGVFAAAMCFDITLPINLVSSLSGLVQRVFETLGGIAG
jgi:hypothetical protein